METHLVRVGRRVLLTSPNTEQYGHLALELLLSMLDARDRDADMYVIHGPSVVGDGLLAIDSPEVKVLRPGPLREKALKALWRWNASGVSGWRPAAAAAFRFELAHELKLYLESRTVPARTRGAIRRWRDRTLIAYQHYEASQRRDKSIPYYRRRRLLERIPVQLHASAASEATRAAAALGIAPDAPIVTLHVREAGFKQGRELHQRKVDARDESTRNARIESYFDAIDALVADGYTVVRLGDPTMTPVSRRGVVDLATSPGRSNMLEVHCLLKSEFLIACEAGPAAVAYLTNTPTLTVNATDPISSYPVRGDGLYILKTVVDRRSGRALSLDEQLTRSYHVDLRKTHLYEYQGNTPEQIAGAVAEMRHGVRHGFAETARQKAFRERVVTAAEELRHQLRYVRKWGLDDGFLGEGRIAAGFIDRQWPAAWGDV